MKKKISILLTIVLCISIFPGCDTTGGSTNTTQNVTTQPPSATIDSFEGYSIVYDAVDDIQKRMAVKLQEAISSKVENLTLLKAFFAEDDDAKPYIRFENDGELADGNYRISVTDHTVRIFAGDYNGFSGAVNDIAKMVKQNQYPFADGYEKIGNFADTLGLYENATAYAYERAGEHRIMFYNVLWSNPSPDERNELQSALIGEYLPDVLGLQEFNITKRGNETGSAGDGGLVELLKEFGYSETIDARVENVSQKACDDWGKNYNNTGYPVTVDGKNIRTFYNNTPLFYNTNTTEYLDGGYHMYENQYDEENGKGSSNPMGGPSSCASKSLTWGIFRNKDTQEVYAVISTHMCTRSNGVRGLQAGEAIRIVNQITEKYQCPVFLGGDMNGNLGDANYDRFVSEEVGYASLQDSQLATKYTSNVHSYLGSPENNSKYDLVMQGGVYPKLIMQVENKNSIDHIFITDRTKVEIGVFGVIVDECSRAASDHLPIFADFSIQ